MFEDIESIVALIWPVAGMNDQLEALPKSHITNEKPQDCRNWKFPV